MKRMTKPLVIAAAVCLLALPLGACGMNVTGDVSVAKKKVTMDSRVYITQADLDLAEKSLAATGANMSAADMGYDLSKMDKVTIDGKEYYTSDDPNTGLHTTQAITSKQLKEATCVLDSNKFVIYGTDEESATGMLPSDAQVDTSALSGVDPEKLIDFATLKFTFDKTPLASNGKIAGKTATYTGLDQMFCWTAFTEKASKAKASSIKPSVKNKAFTKKSYVTFKTPGIIKSYKIDGKARGPQAVLVNDKLKMCTVKFAKQGKHKITVKLTSKAKKTFTFTYDKGKPTTNVKAKKTYKKGKKLTVKDTYALKYVKLDGKKLKLKSKGKKASVKLKKKGSHKLVAKDKAGNKITVKFKVK